jgi:hypothetical protein
VLNEYYNARHNNQGATQEEIKSKIPIDDQILDDVIMYLLKKGYIEHPYLGPYSKITYLGIDAIEKGYAL